MKFPFHLSEVMLKTISEEKLLLWYVWLLASPGPRGSLIFVPFWGQVTKPLFFKLHDR